MLNENTVSNYKPPTKTKVIVTALNKPNYELMAKGLIRLYEKSLMNENQ